MVKIATVLVGISFKRVKKKTKSTETNDQLQRMQKCKNDVVVEGEINDRKSARREFVV